MSPHSLSANAICKQVKAREGLFLRYLQGWYPADEHETEDDPSLIAAAIDEAKTF
jgi:hypothetical protein